MRFQLSRTSHGDAEARCRRRDSVFVAAAVGTFAFAIGVLMVAYMVEAGIGDHRDHLERRVYSESASYSILFPAIRVFAEFFSPEVALVALIGIAVAARAVLVFGVLWRGGLPTGVAGLGSVLLVLVMPLPLLGAESPSIYLGQQSANIWHNSTTMVLFPFALAAFALALKALASDECIMLPAASLAIAVSVLAKPNFALAFLPVVTAMALLSGDGRLKKRIRGAAILTAPSLLLLMFQYVDNILRGRLGVTANVLVVDPFVQWRAFTDSIPLSIMRSLAFPLTALLASALLGAVSRHQRVAWAVYVVSTLQFAILSENFRDGSPILHGNWGWAMHVAVFLLFVYGLRDWAAGVQARAGTTKAFGAKFRLAVGVPAVLLVAHSASGVAYLVQILVLQSAM